MVSLHLTLPVAVTAQMPWEEFSAALEREQGLGFRQRVKQGHMFGAQSENCLAVPLFTCLLFQGWLAGPPVSLSSRELGKISCFLIYLWRGFTCVVSLSSLPPDTMPPFYGELWSCPSSIVILEDCVWSSSHPPTAPPLSQADLGLGSRRSHVFFPFPFRIFQLLSSLPFSDSTLDS